MGSKSMFILIIWHLNIFGKKLPSVRGRKWGWVRPWKISTNLCHKLCHWRGSQGGWWWRMRSWLRWRCWWISTIASRGGEVEVRRVRERIEQLLHFVVRSVWRRADQVAVDLQNIYKKFSNYWSTLWLDLFEGVLINGNWQRDRSQTIMLESSSDTKAILKGEEKRN